ncbi:hypothetical protein [Heyndrickxia sporothermodurans]|uniref:hypothetical protein n=1 Tax=Heyndrickxia sporothermodurans TaxID=46224 RepID=UPI002E1A834F|nr:hypothetical protein [Heyndrickxia sporothermodurans]MED3697944.1 hypothetical protein [Heyndrickxia sporothermodurans]
MAYNLQTSQTSFKGGKNILASEHVQFVEAGATIKGGEGQLAVGQAVARVAADGKWVKFADADVANYDDFGILNVDVDATTFDAIVGELIVRGSVYDAKLVGATDAFKAEVPNIRFVKHI